MKSFKTDYKEGDLIYYIDDNDSEIIRTGIILKKSTVKHSGYSFRARSIFYEVLTDGEVLKKSPAAIFDSREKIIEHKADKQYKSCPPDAAYKKR